MDIKEELEKMKSIVIIKESLIDYAGPIFIFGNIKWLLKDLHPTIISATMPKKEFVILNNRIPKWVDEIKKNLIIKIIFY